MKTELTFVVDKVMNSANPSEQFVEAVQKRDYSIPYAESRIMLRIYDDDELKKYGPGLELKVTIEG